MIQVCIYFAPHKKGDEPINEPIKWSAPSRWLRVAIKKVDTER